MAEPVNIGMRVVDHSQPGLAATGRSFGALANTIRAAGLARTIGDVAFAFGGNPVAAARVGGAAARGGWGLLGVLGNVNRALLAAGGGAIAAGAGLALLVPVLIGLNAAHVTNWERMANSLEIIYGVDDATAKNIIDIAESLTSGGRGDTRTVANLYASFARLYGPDADRDKLTAVADIFTAIENVGGEKTADIGGIFVEMAKVFEVPQERLDGLITFLTSLSQVTGVSIQDTLAGAVAGVNQLQNLGFGDYESLALSGLVQSDARLNFGQFLSGLDTATRQGFSREDLASFLSDRNRTLEEIDTVFGAANRDTFRNIQMLEGQPFEQIRSIFVHGEEDPFIQLHKNRRDEILKSLGEMEDDQENFFTNLDRRWDEFTTQARTPIDIIGGYFDDVATNFTNAIFGVREGGMNLPNIVAHGLALANPLTAPFALSSLSNYSFEDFPRHFWETVDDTFGTNVTQHPLTVDSGPAPEGWPTTPGMGQVDLGPRRTPEFNPNIHYTNITVSPTGSFISTTEEFGDEVIKIVNEAATEGQTQSGTAPDNTELTPEARRFLEDLGLTP